MHNSKRLACDLGFTLLELMITVGIIAIIAAIAMPSYMNYMKKTYYSELVRATSPYKLGVVECYNVNSAFEHCNSQAFESQGIPPEISHPPNARSAIKQISVKEGIITGTPTTINGIEEDEIYILTPTASNGLISWTASGKGVDHGLAK